MRRSWLIAGVLLAVGFLAATWLRHAGERRDGIELEGRTIDKERVQAFWSAYHQATEHRINGDYGRAAETYRKALRLDADHEESLYYLGNSLLELGRLQQAEEAYLKLTRLNPRSQRAFSQLGAVSSTLRPGGRVDWMAAQRAFERCIEINREESGPFLRLGWISLQQGQLDEAAAHFQTAAGFRSPEGFFLSGFVEFVRGRYADAVGYFVRVLELGAKEAKIAGRGHKSEGDVADPEGPMTPLQAAQVKARAYLFWTAARLGGYPDETPVDFRISQPEVPVHPGRVSRRADFKPNGAAVAVDFDGDGDLDIATSGGHSRPAKVFRNQNGRLSDSPYRLPGDGGSDLSWGDSDQDGDLDLLLIRARWGISAPPELYANQTDSANVRFSAAGPPATVAGLEHVIRGRFLDYDGDGLEDLVLAAQAAPALFLLRNGGDHRFSLDTRSGLAPIDGPATDLQIGDLDGDGRFDLLLIRWRQAPVLLQNQGGGRFRDVTEPWGLKHAVAPGFRGLLLDYDRDDDLDLLLSGFSPYGSVLQSLFNPEAATAGERPRLFANEDGERFVEVTSESGLPALTSTVAMAAADLNADGWVDLVLAEGGPEMERLSPSRVLLNRRGRFEPSLLLPSLREPLNAEGVAVADSDGDGRPEIWLSGAGLYSVEF